MIEVKNLLSKWNNLILSEGFKKSLIKEALFIYTNLDINSENIEIKNNNVYLLIKPIYKNEIFLKKDKILNFLEKNIGKNYPKNFK